MKFAAVLQRILPPVWLGMLCAIAMEAQLKFQAPGITRELGLGIGKLVFTALNRIECVIALILAVALFAFRPTKRARIVLGSILLILAAQTFWLIPKLIERIDLIVGGNVPPDSNTHLIYIALEILKAISLLALSVIINLPKENETGH